MIKEDYASLEIAELLKNKGFNEPCHAFYDGKILKYIPGVLRNNTTCISLDNTCIAPTLQMVMKWLREEKHYYIQVMFDYLGYYVVIQKTDSGFEMNLYEVLEETSYGTYEEACESAIKYCLENLI